MTEVTVVPVEVFRDALRANHVLMMALQQLLSHPGTSAPPHLVQAVQALSGHLSDRLVAAVDSCRVGVLE